jgi:hypothetical protein
MEQARRPTLENYVHGVAPMGTRVLVNGALYQGRFIFARAKAEYSLSVDPTIFPSSVRSNPLLGTPNGFSDWRCEAD